VITADGIVAEIQTAQGTVVRDAVRLNTEVGFVTRQAIEAHSCNHCCSGKAIRIACFGCVSAALGIQHAISTHHVVISDLSGSTIFCTLSHKRHYFRNEKFVEQKMYVWIFSTTFV
jgi:hypothetical protein